MNRKVISFMCAIVIVFAINMEIVPRNICAVENPILNKTDLILYINSKVETSKETSWYYLKVANATARPSWTSSDKTIATVTKNGTVIAKKKGKTKITAKIGNEKLQCNVNVKYVPSVAALLKLTSIKYKIQDGFIFVTYKNKYDDILEIGTYLYQYDSNGDFVKKSKIAEFVSSKKSLTVCYQLDKKTSYIDIDDRYAEICNNCPDKIKNLKSGIYEYIDVDNVDISIYDDKLRDSYGDKLIEFSYKITNLTCFDLMKAEGQIVFCNDEKPVAICSISNGYSDIEPNQSYFKKDDYAHWSVSYGNYVGCIFIPLICRRFISCNDQ